jgi:hypothetical protein
MTWLGLLIAVAVVIAIVPSCVRGRKGGRPANEPG